MIITYSEEASIDIEEAMVWFESKQAGLGRKFKSSVSDTIRQIKQYPMAGRDIGNSLQVRLSIKFSFKIAYEVRGSTICVVKIWHSARDANP